MKRIKSHIVLVLLMAILSLPLLQMWFGPFRERPLDGAFTRAEMVSFTHRNWSSGKFQDQAEKFLKDHIGFRNDLVRLQNQIDFSLFRKANAEGATVGKNGQLFEYDYIRSWLGIDHPGEAFIRAKLNRAKFVQDHLKKEMNIDLVIVFEPGKASFYPEFIPSRYARLKNKESLYENYVRLAREAGLDYIDLQAYFMQLKHTAEYPLFPSLGTHWSVYGMTFAADSLLKFIEQRREIGLAPVTIDSTEYSSTPRDTDDDVARTMNLICPPNAELLAYPVLRIDTSGNFDKPMVLTVADSYYWNIFNTRIPKYVFANEAFWYFNALVYPDYYGGAKYTHELDLRSEVEKQDVIFLMVTERFLHKFDWTFIDQLYALYTPEWLRDPVYDNINSIMKNDPWFNQILARAESKGEPLEEVLAEEARYMIYNTDTAYFFQEYGPQHYMKIISENPGWMDYIRKKAAEQGLSVEETLYKDALFVFKQDHPARYEMNRDLESVEKEINVNPAIKDSLVEEAARYRFDEDVFLRLEAREILKERQVEGIMRAIRGDQKWLEDVSKKAQERGLGLEEMIRLDALWVVEQKWK